jgi:glycosyltransferase involved in cell wall biosynthesis
MRVLHYSLGFPPTRRGGMTTYCMDLMDAQAMAGDEVALLWPGSFWAKSQECSIKRRPLYTLPCGRHCGSFTIENSLPVTLIDGVANPLWQLQQKDISVFNHFFENGSFDVLHLHTIMGMPLELVKAAINNDIPVIFTTHDYYPLCAKLLLFRDGNVCVDDDGCRKCCACNADGLSIGMMRVLQSPLYGALKETPIVRALRSRHNERADDLVAAKPQKCDWNDKKAEQYRALRTRNVSLLNSVNEIVYNSKLTQEIYHRYGVSNPFEDVIHVTNSSSYDHRQVVKASEKVRFGYMGGPTVHKGCHILVEACDSLWNCGYHNFELHTFGDFDLSRPYAICHQRFNKSELAMAMSYLDIALIPSVWYETFGFVASEAMSFGKPVIISTRVGAKDYVKDGYNGRIVTPDSISLASAMKDFLTNPELIECYSERICGNDMPLTMSKHCEKIRQLYRVACVRVCEQGKNGEC